MHTLLLYVDPGSGSYLVQMIIAAVVGAMFYFKTAWWKIKSFFSHKQDNSSKDKTND